MSQIKLFYSYSHKDEELKEELEKHLSLLRREGIIDDWDFRKIEAGKEWENEINRKLKTADVILLLISPDFIFSEYCYSFEMKQAMVLHNSGKSRVIPVILRAVDWKRAPFGKLEALPTNGKAVTSWSNRDEALLDISVGIRKVCESIANTTKRRVNSSPTPKIMIRESDNSTNGLYCSKCGVQAGGAPSTCFGLFGSPHEFKKYSGNVFCSRCGVIPGNRTHCIGLGEFHDFKKYKGAVYCTNCGLKAGEKMACTNILHIYHDFSLYRNDVHCSRCGTKPGKKTACIGMYTSHDFKTEEDVVNRNQLRYL